MNIYDIVREYLEKNGYEGLFCATCSCELSDLFPCGEGNASNCVAGYKVPCPGVDDCEAFGDCRFHIGNK